MVFSRKFGTNLRGLATIQDSMETTVQSSKNFGTIMANKRSGSQMKAYVHKSFPEEIYGVSGIYLFDRETDVCQSLS